MSATRDLNDLLDQITEVPGWRVVTAKDGFRIYPADPKTPSFVLHTTSSAKDNQLADLRSRLRRANFPFRNGNSLPPNRPTVKEPSMAAANTSPVHANGAATEAAAIDEASNCIARIIDELGTLEGLLKRIKADGEEITRIKASLSTLLGR